MYKEKYLIFHKKNIKVGTLTTCWMSTLSLLGLKLITVAKC